MLLNCCTHKLAIHVGVDRITRGFHKKKAVKQESIEEDGVADPELQEFCMVPVASCISQTVTPAQSVGCKLARYYKTAATRRTLSCLALLCKLYKERIYANWIKEELQKEAACLELPFSVVFLASFAARRLLKALSDCVFNKPPILFSTVMQSYCQFGSS